MAYDFSNLTVFVVYDSPFTQRLVGGMLRAMDIHRVRAFKSMTDAIAGSRHLPPDIMIIDYMLDGRDDLDAVKLVRSDKDERIAFMPVIVLTAYTEKWRVTAARDSGANEIVALPVSVRRLYRAIEEIVERPRPFVRTKDFFGPDRRRQQREFEGEDRRKRRQEAPTSSST
jgi:CheY-like chemotaxis protein